MFTRGYNHHFPLVFLWFSHQFLVCLPGRVLIWPGNCWSPPVLIGPLDPYIMPTHTCWLSLPHSWSSNPTKKNANHMFYHFLWIILNKPHVPSLSIWIILVLSFSWACSNHMFYHFLWILFFLNSWFSTPHGFFDVQLFKALLSGARSDLADCGASKPQQIWLVFFLDQTYPAW